jgi:exodeoxyribonuclease X
MTIILRVIDFETTGTEPPAEVCEAGYCDFNVESRAISDPVSWLCHAKTMPPEVRAVHNISLAEVANCAPFDEGKLYQGATCIVAHNASFEMKFISTTLPVICTYKSALRAWPDAPSHGNGALRYWLEDQGLISPSHEKTQPVHRAGPDAYVTAHILKALFDAGHTGKEMVAWSKEPPLLPKCTIGKYRGKPWSEVDAGFLGWMLRQEGMDEDLKWNARREIDRRQSGGTGLEGRG